MYFKILILFVIILLSTLQVPAANTGEIGVETTVITGDVTWENQTRTEQQIIIDNGASLTLINTSLQAQLIKVGEASRLRILGKSRLTGTQSYETIMDYGRANIVIDDSVLVNLARPGYYGIYLRYDTNLTINNTVIVSKPYRTQIGLIKTSRGTITLTNITTDNDNLISTLYPGPEATHMDGIVYNGTGIMRIQTHGKTFNISRITGPRLGLLLTAWDTTRESRITQVNASISLGITTSSRKLLVADIESPITYLRLSRTNGRITDSRLGGTASFSIDNSNIYLDDTEINATGQLVIESSTVMVNKVEINSTVVGKPAVELKSAANTVINNTVIYGRLGNLAIYSSTNTTIMNTYIKEGITIQGGNPGADYPKYYRHKIINTTTLYGPILYMENTTDTIINASHYSQVFITNAANTIIEDYCLSRPASTSIQILSSSNITIRDSSINTTQLYSESGTYTPIIIAILWSNNTVINNTYVNITLTDTSSHGIYYYYSLNNTVAKTVFYSNKIGNMISSIAGNGVFKITNTMFKIRYAYGAIEFPHYINSETQLEIKNTNIEITGGTCIQYSSGSLVIDNLTANTTRGTLVRFYGYNTGNITMKHSTIYSRGTTIYVNKADHAEFQHTYIYTRGYAIMITSKTIGISDVHANGTGSMGFYIRLNGQRPGENYIKNTSIHGYSTDIFIENPMEARLENISMDHGLAIRGNSIESCRIRPVNVMINDSELIYLENNTNIVLEDPNSEIILVNATGITIKGNLPSRLSYNLIQAYSSGVMENAKAADATAYFIYTDHSSLEISNSTLNGSSGYVVYIKDSNILFNGSRIIDTNGMFFYTGNLTITDTTISSETYNYGVIIASPSTLAISNTKLVNASIRNNNIYAYTDMKAEIKNVTVVMPSGYTAIFIKLREAVISDSNITGRLIVTASGRVTLENTILRRSRGMSVYGAWVIVKQVSLVDREQDTSGHVFLHGGNIYVANSTFKQYNKGLKTTGSNAIIYNTSIVNTAPTLDGGGLYCYGRTFLVNTTIKGYGQAIYVYGSADVRVLNSTIVNNSRVYHLYSNYGRSTGRFGNTVMTGNYAVNDNYIMKMILYYTIITGNTYGFTNSYDWEANISIHNSNIYGNALHGAIIGRGTINATQNYWGSPTGPDYTSSADAVDPEEVYSYGSGTIYYQNYLTAPFTRDATPPEITMAAVNTIQAVSGTIHVSYTATDNEEIIATTVMLNDTLIGVYDGGSVAAEIDTTGLEDGIYRLTINAYDYAGNKATCEKWIRVDNTPPITLLTSPANHYISGIVTFAYNTINEYNATSTLYVNGSVKGVENTLTPTYIIDTTIYPDGNYSFNLTTIDETSHSSWRIDMFTIDNTPPQTTICETNGSIISGTWSAKTNTYDENAYRSTLTINNTTIETWQGNGNHTTQLDTTQLPDGWYTLGLSTTDLAGNTNTSTISILVDNTDPRLEYLNVQGNNTYTQTIVLKTKIYDMTPDNLTITLDDQIIYTGPYTDEVSITISNITPGTHIVKINATDKAGNTMRTENTIYILRRQLPSPEPTYTSIILAATLLVILMYRKRQQGATAN